MQHHTLLPILLFVFSTQPIALALTENVCTSHHPITQNPPIIGHVSHTQSNVCEWLGIPYAKPPVGKLRFSRPETAEPEGDAFMADAYVSLMNPYEVVHVRGEVHEVGEFM